MHVRLKYAWFSPDSYLMDPRDGIHEVPDEWRDLLPSSAEVLDDVSDAEAEALERELEKRRAKVIKNPMEAENAQAAKLQQG